MEIFQLNEYQETILKRNAEGHFYVCNVAQEDDDKLLAKIFTDNLGHVLELVAQELMVEVPTEEDQTIQNMKEKYKRDAYKMFKLTPMASTMFSPVLVKGSEDGTFRNVADTIH